MPVSRVQRAHAVSWLGLDEQRVSRSGGRTGIHGLRSGLDFGRRHLALTGLETDHDAFVNTSALPPKPPTPAKAVTVAVFMHLLWHAQFGGSPVATLCSLMLVTCCIAALRVRDTQRASLRVVRGSAVLTTVIANSVSDRISVTLYDTSYEHRTTVLKQFRTITAVVTRDAFEFITRQSLSGLLSGAGGHQRRVG